MRLRLAAVLSALTLFLPFSNVGAQTYPDRPIKIIVPYGAGGVDVQLRLAQAFMEPLLGQRLVIENRPGAGAIMGTSAVRNANPDGYTLLFTGTSALSVIPHMKRVTYTMDDFVPIGNLTGTALALVARADAPYKTLAELIDYAKQNPGKVNMGSTGVGTTTHMIGEALQLTAGIKFTHIPYTGNAQVVGAMLSGSTDVFIGIPGSFMSQVNAGTLRALATTGSVRSEFLPQAPTLKESGLNVVEVTKFGLLAPKGLTPSAVNKLANALKVAVQGKEFVDKMRASYITPHYLDSAGFVEALRQEDKYWSAMLSRPEFQALVEN